MSLCNGIAPSPLGKGINPRGLIANSIWQTGITHIPEFANLKYVHVSIDTYSHFLMATSHTGEKACDTIRHWHTCFTTLGLPNTIKTLGLPETINRPAYISEQVGNFLQQWCVSHHMGIPHSPTGQVIAECAHRTLKTMPEKQKGGVAVPSWQTS